MDFNLVPRVLSYSAPVAREDPGNEVEWTDLAKLVCQNGGYSDCTYL